MLLKKDKNTVTWWYEIEDLHGGEIVAPFYEKTLQNANQTKLRIAKSNEEKTDKLYIKRKCNKIRLIARYIKRLL